MVYITIYFQVRHVRNRFSRNFMVNSILTSREIRNSRSLSTRIHDTDSTCPRKIPFYCAKLNFTFVTYIYITIREIPIKMQWKFVSNVVCLIAEFSSFSASCNMPFRITKMLFLLPYIISSISSFFNFFSYFFIYFLEFFSLLKFPHSYNSTRFSRGRITAEQDCERINSNFGNIQE